MQVAGRFWVAARLACSVSFRRDCIVCNRMKLLFPLGKKEFCQLVTQCDHVGSIALHGDASRFHCSTSNAAMCDSALLNDPPGITQPVNRLQTHTSILLVPRPRLSQVPSSQECRLYQKAYHIRYVSRRVTMGGGPS
jgi:hypothetical protein